MKTDLIFFKIKHQFKTINSVYHESTSHHFQLTNDFYLCTKVKLYINCKSKQHFLWLIHVYLNRRAFDFYNKSILKTYIFNKIIDLFTPSSYLSIHKYFLFLVKYQKLIVFFIKRKQYKTMNSVNEESTCDHI